MERKLQERMVGAGLLLLLLVIVGPMILDGAPDDGDREEAVPGQRNDELRTHTFQLNHSAPAEVAPSAPTPTSAGPSVPVEARNAAVPAPPPAAAVARAATPATGNVPPTAAPAPAAVVKPAEQQLPVTPPKPPPQDSAAQSAPRATAGDTGWLVQVGMFGQKDNAERLVSGLKRQGFAAFMSPTERGGKTFYRVRVGPAGTRESAAGVAGRLAAAGQQGQVVAQ